MSIAWPDKVLEKVSENPFVVINPKTWGHYHTYGASGKFFHGLRDRKLLATRCTNPTCPEKRLWLPPRPDCPDCWQKMEWCEAPQHGRIYTWSIVKYPGALFKLPPGTPLISVELDGVCTKLMSWLKEGEPRIGMAVRAEFNTAKPTNTILDLAWVPA